MPDTHPNTRSNAGLAIPENHAAAPEREWRELLAIIDQLSERLHEVESHALPPPAPKGLPARPAMPSRKTRWWLKFKIAYYKTTLNTRGLIKYRHKLASLDQPIGDAQTIGILSPPHTRFVAQAIERLITDLGLKAAMIDPDRQPIFDHDLYIVLCPQVFSRLPPGDRMVVYQFEQCQAPRWQEENYLKLLRSARAVLDYSVDNLGQLDRKGIGYPQTFHVGVQAQRLGSTPSAAPAPAPATSTGVAADDQAPIDVLFYGATNNERRRRILDAVAQQVPVRIETELFGDALHALLRRTRVVLNIHYYDDALLETTRIHECLSLGVEVVSEVSIDQVEHRHLSGPVSFVELGDVAAMVQAIRERLARPRPDTSALVADCDAQFRFQFGRFMLAQQLIDEKAFQNLTADWLIPSDTICLTLPESIERHQLIRHEPPLAARIFEGLRQPLGWQGCALSYKYLCSKAIEQNLSDLLVVEDDVVLSDESAQRLHDIRRALKNDSQSWDLFSGLIADVHPDTRVLDVRDLCGQTLITIDRMTSTVCNIYNRRAMEIIARWRSSNKNANRNTIDRYLEQYPSLRIVTTLPFLAGHRSESHSTLWGIQNSQYDPMIQASQQRLQDKVDEFLRTRAARASRALSR